ncbi:hypothetical protein CAEBREN_23735 [Caenorhabditis brenneri]|uniref:CUB domain-containing protein n=1 Tax=Caenorhabditis brenneri TaxID=135651 RepID=G0M6M0_CAEBE|nr:hypothetical protein CAEBREN_23735 [Caenorhabditis brenneri]
MLFLLYGFLMTPANSCSTVFIPWSSLDSGTFNCAEGLLCLQFIRAHPSLYTKLTLSTQDNKVKVWLVPSSHQSDTLVKASDHQKFSNVTYTADPQVGYMLELEKPSCDNNTYVEYNIERTELTCVCENEETTIALFERITLQSPGYPNFLCPNTTCTKSITILQSNTSEIPEKYVERILIAFNAQSHSGVSLSIKNNDSEIIMRVFYVLNRWIHVRIPAESRSSSALFINVLLLENRRYKSNELNETKLIIIEETKSETHLVFWRTGKGGNTTVLVSWEPNVESPEQNGSEGSDAKQLDGTQANRSDVIQEKSNPE